jgi:uncharacterized protein (DUF362 family)
MNQWRVAVVRYTQPRDSLRQAVALCRGLEKMPPGAKVFIKPNIVFWTRAVPFPKWGVITTSRVVADMVTLLKDLGIDDITIGEGMVTRSPKDVETPAHAFASLGYNTLSRRYGVKVLNLMQRPFKKVDLGDGIALNYNQDMLASDFIVNLPVLKSHNQTIVSLGIKNLKGAIDIASRKKCHSADPQRNLHYMVARLADPLPPIFTLIDGIYSLERGPAFDGRVHRSNLLVASEDVLAADMVGARLLGHAPENIPHLALAAQNRSRPVDLSDVTVVGERIEDCARYHEYDFPYVDDARGCMPRALANQGITGLYYRKFDLSLCTYCSGLNGLALTAIRSAWKGEPFDGVEILTGKSMQPTPGMKKTILLGKCMYQAHKEHPDINQMFAVKGCPPRPEDIVKALHQAGIDVDPGLFANIDQLPGFFMSRYEDKPEFDEAFFRAG